MLIVDLNVEPDETSVTGFCKIYNLTNLIKKNVAMIGWYQKGQNASKILCLLK